MHVARARSTSGPGHQDSLPLQTAATSAHLQRTSGGGARGVGRGAWGNAGASAPAGRYSVFSVTSGLRLLRLPGAPGCSGRPGGRYAMIYGQWAVIGHRRVFGVFIAFGLLSCL
jgi:hypothetical protein